MLLNEVGRQVERHTRGDQSAYFFLAVSLAWIETFFIFYMFRG